MIYIGMYYYYKIKRSQRQEFHEAQCQSWRWFSGMDTLTDARAHTRVEWQGEDLRGGWFTEERVVVIGTRCACCGANRLGEKTGRCRGDAVSTKITVQATPVPSAHVDDVFISRERENAPTAVVADGHPSDNYIFRTTSIR